MRLKFFKYMPAKYALATLRTGLIKVATTADVNDPNEIMPWISSDGSDAPRDQIESLARFWLSEKYGFISLSTSWDSNPMWGLYADKFRGMALVFDYDWETKDAKLYPVKYSAWRYHITDGELAAQRNDADPHERMLALYANKDKTWAFESEWRRMVSIDEAKANQLENGETGYFVDVNRYLNLTGVIIGPDSPATFVDIANALQGRCRDDFTVTKLCHDTRSFSLQFLCRKKWLQGRWCADCSTAI